MGSSSCLTSHTQSRLTAGTEFTTCQHAFTEGKRRWITIRPLSLFYSQIHNFCLPLTLFSCFDLNSLSLLLCLPPQRTDNQLPMCVCMCVCWRSHSVCNDSPGRSQCSQTVPPPPRCQQMNMSHSRLRHWSWLREQTLPLIWDQALGFFRVIVGIWIQIGVSCSHMCMK